MPSRTVARRDFLEQLAALAALPAPSMQPTGDRPRFMYVGSFTGEGRGRGEGLSVFERKSEQDAWSLIQVVKDVADPSFLTIDRERRFLYSAHGGGTQATSYGIDRQTGRLTILNRQPTGGVNGVHLAIDATGRCLALANYASGSLVVLPVNRDGTLAPYTALVTLSGEPGPHRTQQTSSHPHACPFDRTGRHVVVPDKGLDRIFVYRLDPERGSIVEGKPPSVTSRAGAAPRHVDFHPTRPWAYVINELDSTMTTYRFDPDKGLLEPLQTVPTLPTSYTGNNTGAEVFVAPSGRFVYGSNRGHDSIVIFEINQKTGELAPVGWEATRGRTPRFFCLDPSGAHLYAANQNSDTVVIFRVDRATGRLTPTRQVVDVKSPSSIVFA